MKREFGPNPFTETHTEIPFGGHAIEPANVKIESPTQSITLNSLWDGVSGVRKTTDAEILNKWKVGKMRVAGSAKLTEFLHGGFPEGAVSIITSSEGNGKSEFVKAQIVQAREERRPIVIYSGENTDGDYLSRIIADTAGYYGLIDVCDDIPGVPMEQQGTHKEPATWVVESLRNYYAPYMRSFEISIGSDGDADTKGIQQMRETMIETCTRAKMAGLKKPVFVIDNLATIVDLGGYDFGLDTNSKQSFACSILKEVAREYGCIVILVAHARKPQGGDKVASLVSSNPNDEISGSGNVKNYAGLILQMARDAEDPTSKIRIVRVCKNRLFGELDYDGFRLDWDFETGRYYDEGDIDGQHGLFRKYEWRKEIKKSITTSRYELTKALKLEEKAKEKALNKEKLDADTRRAREQKRKEEAEVQEMSKRADMLKKRARAEKTIAELG